MKRIFILLLMLFGMIGFANAIDYDNITFTNEEFYNGAIGDSVVKQLNETHIALLWGGNTAGDIWYGYCENDGTNCVKGNMTQTGITNLNNLDMIIDNDNNQTIIVMSRTSFGQYRILEFDGTPVTSFLTFNSGGTNYVSAVQTNSTDFAIAYQDTADSSDASIIICKLDGTGCGTETDMDVGINSNNKIIKNSNSKITYAMVSSGGILYIREASLTGSPLGSWQSINTGGTSSIDMIEGSDNKLKIVYRDDGSTNDGTFRTCDLDGTNCGSEIVYHSGVATYNNLQEINDKLFVQYQKETTGEGLSLNFNLTGGNISATSSFTANSTSYISSVYTSNNQLVISYNDNTASKGTFAISESLSPGATITFNNPTQGQYLNSTSIPLNVTFSTITNSTYILNAGNETTLCTNCNESSNVTLTGVEGLNNLTILTNTLGQLTNSSINFTIDTINPSLTTTLPSEYNFFDGFNFSSYITVSDTNLDTCIVEVVGQSNTTCTDEIYNFSNSGNVTINVYATDLAGNTNDSLNNVILINPLVSTYFQTSGNVTITNYTFGGRSDNGTGLVQFNYYNDGLVIGTNSLEFDKLGYQTQSFNFNLTNASPALNQTFTASDAVISIEIRDKETSALITGVNFTAEFIATVGLSTSTTTGVINVSNVFFLEEDYRVVISNANYRTESLFFTFTNKELLETDAFMIEANNTQVGLVFIKAVDRFSQPLSSVIVEALQWNPTTSAYERVSSSLTGSDGVGSLNVILEDKTYIFRATLNGLVAESESEIIEEFDNGKEITITLSAEASEQNYLLQNLFTDVTESFNNVTNISTITFEWNDLQGLSQTVCVNAYRLLATTQTQIAENCVSGVSGTLIQAYLINGSYPTVIKAEVKIGGEDLFPIKSFRYDPQDHPSVLFDSTGLVKIIIPLLFLVSIGLGMFMANIYIGTFLLMVSSGISLILAPTLTNGGITAFFFFLGYIIISKGVKIK